MKLLYELQFLDGLPIQFHAISVETWRTPFSPVFKLISSNFGFRGSQGPTFSMELKIQIWY